MSITSIPVKANDKNKPECIFSSIDMFFFTAYSIISPTVEMIE